MVETTIVVFIVLFVLLAIIQFALLYNAKTVLNYATYEAARSGAVNHGAPEAMKYALAGKLAAIKPTDLSDTGITGSAFGRLQNAQLAVIEEIDAGGKVCIERISPTNNSGHWQSVSGGGLEYSKEIPNSHLLYRSDKPDFQDQLSIQDANLLKIQVTYCHKMVVPIVSTAVKRLMLTQFASADPDPLPGWQVPNLADFERQCYANDGMPIEAQSVVRMQSPIRNYQFPAYCQ